MQAAFESTRANILPRPWAVDDLNAVLQVWQRKHYSKALLFVDNAGSDVVLGTPFTHAYPRIWRQQCLTATNLLSSTANADCFQDLCT